MTRLPLYRAKKIDSDIYIQGQYIETEFNNEEYCDIEEQEITIKHCIIKDFRTLHDDYEYCNFDIKEIDPSTLEIYDGLKWRKLSECNFRTDYEMDMHSYNGYCNGWNNALSKDGAPPYKVAEHIMNNK